MAYTGSPSYPNSGTAPAGSPQANAAQPGYGPQLTSGFSYAAGLADAVRNAASFFGNIFSFGTLGGSSPSTSSSPTAAPTATTSPTSSTTPGATTPREAVAARTGPPAQPTYSVTGTAGKTGTTTAAPAAQADVMTTTAPESISRKPASAESYAPAAGTGGYAAGLGISEATAPTDVSNFTDTKFGDAADFTPAPPELGAGVEAAHQAISATPKAGAAAPPARITYNLDPKTAAAGGTTTTMEAEKPVVTNALTAIAAAAPGFGLDRIEVTGGGGAGGGHVSHKYGTEMDIVGYNADGTPWTDAQRLQVANVAAAQGAGRFGLYPGGSLHFGFSDVNPHAAWGPGGTSGIPVGNFPKNDQAFAAWAKSGQPYSAYQGPSRFEGVPGAADPFAGATTYPGLPATAGGFTRDPSGNPVPPANVGAGTSGATPEMASSVDYLMTAGNLTREQAAGLIGGFAQESYPDLRPGAAGDAGVSHGIGQWNDKRWANAQAWATANGRDINDRQTQLDFALHELNTTEKAAGTRLRAAKTLDEAIAAAAGYEGPRGYSLKNPAGADHYANRAAYARSAFGAGGAAEAMAAPAGPSGIDYSIPGAGFVTGGAGAVPAEASAAAKPVAAAAPAPATSAKQPSLKIGSSGPAVRDLQTQLLAAGYNPGPIDGKFGQRTRDALYKFQQATPGTGTRFGYNDAVAGPKVRAALTAANPYRDIHPPEDIVVQPPGGYAAGIAPPTTGAFGEPTMQPDQPPVGERPITANPWQEMAEAGPMRLPLGQPLHGEPPSQPPVAINPTITQGTGGGVPDFAAPMPTLTPAGEAALRGPMPGEGPQGASSFADLAAAGPMGLPGSGYYSGLQSVEEDRASRARIPETVASTYAAITGIGGTDQFAGGPTGGLSAAAPAVTPGMLQEDLDRLNEQRRLHGAAGTPALGGGAGEDQLRDLAAMPSRGTETAPPTTDFQAQLDAAAKAYYNEEYKGVGMQPNRDQYYPDKYYDPGYRPVEKLNPNNRYIDELAPGFKQNWIPQANAGPAKAGAAALTAPEPDVVRTLASLPPEGQAQYRSGFVNNIIDSIDQAGDARGILKAIDASPQASRRLEVVLGPQGASQFKSLVRVDGIGNREPGTRFAAALPSMAGLRGSPPVDSQVAARVGAMLDSDDPAEFSRGLKIVAANPNLQALVQRVDAMV